MCVRTERVIELEQEVVATRKAAVGLLYAVTEFLDAEQKARITGLLQDRASGTDPAEARLARLLAETLRRT